MDRIGHSILREKGTKVVFITELLNIPCNNIENGELLRAF